MVERKLFNYTAEHAERFLKRCFFLELFSMRAHAILPHTIVKSRTAAKARCMSLTPLEKNGPV